MRASGVKRNFNSLVESSQSQFSVRQNMAGHRRSAVLDGKGFAENWEPGTENCF
jgi:hypothetical protein